MPEGGYTKRYTNRGDRGVIGLVGERWSLPRFQAGLLITPDCVTIYDNVKSKFNQKLTVTGHSLGGNLAVNIAIDKPVDNCVVFNAGSGANKTFTDIQGNTEQRNKFKSLITQYYIHGDVSLHYW